MSERAAPFELHIFVCTGGGTCPQQGSGAVHAYLKDAVARAGLRDRVRVNHSGCLDQCGHGPMVVVYPDNIWYSHVSLEDAEAIFTEHILGGRPVERLRFPVVAAGGHKLRRDAGGRPIERCTICRTGTGGA
ncbi:MAG TPA: (2Fe-2S) ferredoxin domain-containing protein [Candidatus Sulfotelmatobacter sp.]|nr:(2Fe-2S) ferredoxin domain-containing protein [Candidatus Sulfotelmatobacter sp.]